MVEIKKILHNKIYYYEQLDSTDLKALELAKQGQQKVQLLLPQGRLPDEDECGGNGNHRRKGLWFSMILRPTIASEYCAQITLLTAVAVVKALQVLTDKIFL